MRGIVNDATAVATYELMHVDLAPVVTQPVPSVMVKLGADSVTFGRIESRPPRQLVLACDGPSCASCAALIADVGFIAGVWLFENDESDGRCSACWHRYTADEFYAASLRSLSVELSAGRMHE
jgi:hypothetical protein